MKFFSPQVSCKYFVSNICYRAVHEQSTKGGILITVRFEKTKKRFGMSVTTSETVTFNNYHTRQKDSHGNTLFTYNPPYVASEGSHSEDSIWHAIGVWRDCEDYPFAPITTADLNAWITDWEKKAISFTCPHCGHKQTTVEETESVICPSCKKQVGVPR